MEFQHVNPGKGSAFVRTRLKSLKTSRVQEFTYKSGESVEEVIIATREMQYLYKEGDNFMFMDNENFEQYSVLGSVMGEYGAYLKENETYQIMILDETAVGVRFPKKVRLKVVETEDAVKGDTVSGAMKEAKLETGAIVKVPLFIKEGELIAVDPDSGTYVERA